LGLVTKNQDSHFFLDEVLMSEDEVSPELISELSNTVSRENYFWIACQSDSTLPSRSNPHLKGQSIQLFIIFFVNKN
jgi:hypothetical protein